MDSHGMAFSLPAVPDVPWKQPWKATWWVDLFQKMGPTFPAPDASEETWKHFVSSCSFAPFVLLSLGILLTIGVLCCTCLCRPRASAARSRNPSSCCTLLVGLATLLLIVLGTVIYWRTGSVTWQTAEAELSRAKYDTMTARDEGARLRSAGGWMLQDLDDIPAPCQAAIAGPLQAMKSEVSNYLAQVDRYWSDIDGLPDRISNVEDVSDKISIVTRIGLLTPLFLVCLCCLSMVLAVACSSRGRCSLCCVQCLGPLLFTPTVLVVAAAAAVQLEVAVVSSSFCADVDLNALAYIKHQFGANSTVYNVSEYYITQSGTNPLLQDLQEASATIKTVTSTVATYGDAIARSCPAWHGEANLTKSLVTAQESISMGQRLLSLDNIYRYYEEVVRKDACETAVIGLGWLVLFQALVGLIFLPWLISLAIRYLKARHIWHTAQMRERLVPGVVFRAEMRGGGAV